MTTATLPEAPTSTSSNKAHAGKYLTFALGHEEYGLEILKVREIFGYMDITAIPQMPEYVKGVINLRGKVIPVINLRAKFSMPEVEVTEHTCIIVVDIKSEKGHVETGIVVDQVSEVLDIIEGNIEPAPQFGSEVDSHIILGMGKVGNDVKILLDIDAVLNDDIIDLTGIAKQTSSEVKVAPEVVTA